MLDKFLTRKNRARLYAVTIAVIALLVGYGVLDDGQAPLWLALAAAVLGVAAPATALGHLTPEPQRSSEPAVEGDHA